MTVQLHPNVMTKLHKQLRQVEKAPVRTLDEVALLGVALAEEEDAQGFLPSTL